MDLESVVDFVNQAHDEIGKFSIEITLSPDKLMAEDYCVDVLAWSSVKYGDAEVNDVPNDRRGIYAFAVSHANDVLPPNGCVLYIGIAGRDSDRSLRARYKDYLNEKKILKRERIARMIGTWHDVLRFYFAPVGDEVSAEDLKTLEKQLNTALLPKFSEGDLDAATKKEEKGISMTKAATEQIALPALRGIMGDWVFYSCLMDIVEISRRVQYAAEIHQNKQLSDMIQRQLKTGRSEQISKYLKTQPERFFNSLVIATYGGDPSWHALSDIRSRSNKPDLKDLDDDTIGSLGFLILRGDEKLFALDGQHRLAGIKKTVKDGLEQDPHDELSVIFVAHKETAKGLERTRRLFTTLNKTARPVSKGDIIALDEDDAMAICVRRLIEKTDMFAGTRIAFVASNNMPVKNTTSLTTIGNLYDVLTILFTSSNFELRQAKGDLQRVRPPDEKLDAYFKYAKGYFTMLGKNFEELAAFFDADDTSEVVAEYRGGHGGNALFRPIGLEIFTRIIATLTRHMSLQQAIKQAALLPRDLTDEPFAELMWNTNTSTIVNAHKVTLRETLLYMLGRQSKQYPEKKLLERYRKETGNEDAELPDPVV